MELSLKNKLNNFPKIYWINLNIAKERRNVLEKSFNTYGLLNERVEAINIYTIHENYTINKGYFDIKCKQRAQCCSASHLKALKTFLDDKTNTDNVCCIAEDDLSFDTLQYWKCNWQTYMKNIPDNYDIVKLCVTNVPPNSKEYVENHYHDVVKINKNNNNGTCIYLIKREFANKIVCKLLNDNKFDMNKEFLIAESLYSLYKCNGYYYPLFTYRNVPSFIRRKPPSDTRFKDAANFLLERMKNEC
jgi:hypothetical protein